MDTPFGAPLPFRLVRALNPTDPRTAHIPTLDGLRAIGVLLVVFVHSHELTKLPLAELQASLFWRFSLAGQMGVDLFFVLSGFLITSILVDTVKKPGGLRTFWIRRVLRIFPVYYLSLSVLIVLASATHLFDGDDMPSFPVGWIGHFLYLSNFVLLARGATALELVILWSLAIEEQFYLFWPIVVRRHDESELLRLALAMIVSAPLLRLAFGAFAANTDAFYFLPFCRMDSIFVGVALALAWRVDAKRAWVLRWRRWALAPALGVLLFLLQRPTYHDEPKSLAWITLNYSALALGWGVVLCNALDAGRVATALLANPVVTFIGKISYGLYLWHPLMLRLVKRAFEGGHAPPVAKFAVHVALSIAVAAASFYAFEKPILRLKDRFAYR